MKNLPKTACLLLIFAILLFSCKKSHSPTVNNNTINNTDSVVIDSNLIGRWQWASTQYDYAPGPTNPATPQNTGDSEVLIFNAKQTYVHILESIIDSGTYSTGHGSYNPYPGSYTFIYDSICYYHGDSIINIDYYNLSGKDTLIDGTGLAGVMGSPGKIFVRE
ncbi:MAG TPA: hypothetical protein VK705_10885 [Ferruginibacter sp.]|jgi:hypothetical protein|nr:hypothetical protein [Ferruginibacter sp.]